MRPLISSFICADGTEDQSDSMVIGRNATNRLDWAALTVATVVTSVLALGIGSIVARIAGLGA